MTRLPTHLLRGRVVRVVSLNSIEVNLQLGFGVSLLKGIRLEGIGERTIPRHLTDAARHCLVVLLGGKRVLVHTDVYRKGRFLVGRVYLDERIYGSPADMGVMAVPFSFDEARVDVSEFYTWLAARDYDVSLVKAMLNRDYDATVRT